jgi:hypothetical protein
MATLSFSEFVYKIFSDCFSKGNLLGSLIEPETSIKKTKLEAGRLSVGIFCLANQFLVIGVLIQDNHYIP